MLAICIVEEIAWSIKRRKVGLKGGQAGRHRMGSRGGEKHQQVGTYNIDESGRTVVTSTFKEQDTWLA